MSNTVPIDESILDFFSLSDNDKVIVVRIGLQCINKSKECSSEEWKIKMDEIENSYISKLNNSEQELKNQIEMFKQYKENILFKMDYNYMNDLDDYLNYYMDCIFYNTKIIKNIPNFVRTIEYKDTIKILKTFKTKKHFVFLYNKSYKKQKD